MASLKHLKDANKGLHKRLKKAEALLLELDEHLSETVYEDYMQAYEGELLRKKIEKLLRTPLDTP
jgi:hypothetical protein